MCPRNLSVPFAFWVLAACGSVEEIPQDPDAAAQLDPDAAAEPDAAAPAPGIADVLECGTPASAGGLAAGTELQRVALDVTAFPGARCNDGTTAFFYFRPATTAAAADRWVIQLQGGGSCASPDECAKRWCSVDTNFGMTQMTATLSPAVGISGNGILQRGGDAGEPNPLGDFNHVFVRYCSSDGWAGTAGDIDVDAAHPITGAPVRYRIAFNGAHIVDAVMATLRRDGAAPPPYTLGGGNAVLPDLDDAESVVLAGSSAGAAGVTHNADRVRELLRGHNADLAYMVMHDSNFIPDLATLDHTTTTMCTASGLCSYESLMNAASDDLFGRRGDESCATWHAANAPATAWQCNDLGHVQRHHVTSPFLVRMGLTDESQSDNVIEAGFSVPGRGAMTVPLFAELVRADLLALPGSSPEEPFGRTPAVFGPPCAKHETLSSNPAVFATTLPSPLGPATVLDAVTTFSSGGSPALVWGSGDPTDCPAD